MLDSVISEFPTIEAVRRGRWCSVCGRGWTFIEGTPKDNDANYCPNCGAKMEEE